MKIDILNSTPTQVKRQLDQAVAAENEARREARARQVEKDLDQRAREIYFKQYPGASEASYLNIATTLKQNLQLDDLRKADAVMGSKLHSIYSDF